MAMNEEARARRYEWRATMLRFDPTDDRKQADAAVFDRAAKLARTVAAARPGFEAASNTIDLAVAEATVKWVKGGKTGDRPTAKAAVNDDPAVLLFRAARDQFAEYLHTDEYRAAVGRCRLDGFTEPTDEELMV